MIGIINGTYYKSKSDEWVLWTLVFSCIQFPQISCAAHCTLNCLHQLCYREQGCVVNMEANVSLIRRFI